MKTLFTSILIIFSIIFSNAQDLLLSEDFDYPIGANLNQHNWKPLTSSTTNPIKITNGLSKSGYSASGGAAYLNKNGQDVIRSFEAVSSDRIYVSFLLDIKKFYYISNNSLQNFKAFPFSPSSYFMFLSSKEQPNVPLLKFSLVIVQLAGPEGHIVVRNAKDEIIADLWISNSNPMNINFSYQLTGENAGIPNLNMGTNGLRPAFAKNQEVIPNLSNIVLCQSDINVGTEAIIDRIRVGRTWESIMPCFTQIENSFAEAFKSFRSKVELKELPYGNKEITYRTCANRVINDINSEALYHVGLNVPITDLEVNMPNGFFATASYGIKYDTNTEKQLLDGLKNPKPKVELKSFHSSYLSGFNYDILNIFFLGDSPKTNSEGYSVTGKPGIYEGEISFTPVGGYCVKQVWKVKGIMEDCDNKSDLLLKEDFDYPKGQTLTQNNWEALTPSSNNPIRVVDGLSTKNYSALGGAAYLNKTGQDVKRTFKTVDKEALHLSFQIDLRDMMKYNWYSTPCIPFDKSMLSPSNYFMFLSSKENPAILQLKFSLISTWCGGPDAYLLVSNSRNEILAITYINPSNLYLDKKETQQIEFVYHLSGEKAGMAFLNGLQNYSNREEVIKNSIFVPNLSNIGLAQSNTNVGSEAIIDRIRVGTTYKSVHDTETFGQVVPNTNFVETQPLNAAVYPNTTAGRIDLLINEKAPEGDFEIRLSDKAGNNLYSNSGTWENQQGEIERILSRSPSGQYLFTVKQGNSSKTIRVFRQE
jgi:hypothetical protein